jgi:hypothetical protein
MPKRGRMSAGTFGALVAWPTILAFLIIGLWHGAGWQFAVFGLIHGVYLASNHAWRLHKKSRGWERYDDRLIVIVPSALLTLGCVVVGLVFFRSPDIDAALRFIAAMLGVNGIGLHRTALFSVEQIKLTAILLAIVWLFPNSQEWLRNFPTGLGDIREQGKRQIQALRGVATWRPSPGFAVALGVLGFFAVAKAVSMAPAEFIYFNF